MARGQGEGGRRGPALRLQVTRRPARRIGLHHGPDAIDGATPSGEAGKGAELYVDKLLPAVREGAEAAGRDVDEVDKLIEIKISYDTDPDVALSNCRFWAPLSLTPEQKHSVSSPQEMERLADQLPIEQVAKRWIVSSDPDEAVEKVVVDRGELTLFVRREHLQAVARAMRDVPELRFEMCSGVSGVHYPGEAGRELHAVYHLLSMTHNRRIRVEGYSDASGNDQYNLDLSYRRARAVVARLDEAAAERLKAEGPNELPAPERRCRMLCPVA